MREKEPPLVGFTVLSQLAVGLATLWAVWLFALPDQAETVRAGHLYLTAGVILGIALTVSMFHLGHPLESYRAIVHAGRSWLSREIVGFGLFGGIVTVQMILSLGFNQTFPELAVITGIAGLAALYASAQVYGPPSYPALQHQVPFLFFFTSTLILGAAFFSYFLAPFHHTEIMVVLKAGLVAGAIIHLLTPLIWLRGNLIERQTGIAFLRSPVFWLRMMIGFAIPLTVIGATRTIPVWLPFLILAGEGAGRVLFFSHVVHTASNLGGDYR